METKTTKPIVHSVSYTKYDSFSSLHVQADYETIQKVLAYITQLTTKP
jgi:hypothetical protein